MFNWQDFLGDISGYRPLYLDTLKELEDAKGAAMYLREQLDKAKEKIRQLELLVPQPSPPELTYIAERDTSWIQHEIDSMGLGIVRLPLDAKYRLTNQSNTLNIIAWDLTDRIKYISEIFDCENFSILLKAMVDLYFGVNHFGVVLDYKSAHSYNLVIYPDGNKSVIEGQSDGVYVWTKRYKDFYSLEGAICAI